MTIVLEYTTHKQTDAAFEEYVKLAGSQTPCIPLYFTKISHYNRTVTLVVEA